jgi:hypothetical protein
MLVVAAAVLCLAGLAGAATSISFLNTYDDDGNTATPMVTKGSGAYLWFDPNNWYGGTPPQFEGETASFSTWEIATGSVRTMDLDGGIVDLVGRGVDPGDVTISRLRRGNFTFIDTSVGKTSYFKVNLFRIQMWSNVASEVPIIANELKLDYRGLDFVQNASLDANTITVGQGHLTVNGPTTTKTVNMIFDNGIAWPYVPNVTFNGPVTGLTTITMADKMWAELDANGNGALGTGTVNVATGSVVVRQAQTTFPTITLGANCTLAGNLAGATYGAGGKVTFQAGSILGDTVGTNNPTRADANGATLYKPVVAITSGTILSGDDGVGPYKGVAIGSWSDSNSLGATIEARPGTGALNIGIAARNMYFDANTTLKGDGTSTTANIKVFPGNGRIVMTSGGINQTAINASVPNLITTFNIDGVPGDKSTELDRTGSDEGWTVLRTSGTAAILPGQTVKITNGVYQMDVEGNTETIQGRLTIGAGGALQLLDSNSTGSTVGAGEPIQSSATGHLEMQDRGLLIISGGDTLGDIGTDASRVTVSGTPMVSFHRADSGYWGANTWTAEITINAAANPGLQKILDQSNIVLQSIYTPGPTSVGNSVFLGDGLRIREGGLVTTTWPMDSQGPKAYVGASTVYFGPANNGGSFTIATGPYVPINLYCPVGDPGRRAGTINVNSTDPIESFDNLTWYPYNVSLGRVVGVPTGTVTFLNTIYADQLVVRNGTCTLDGANVAAGGVHVIAEKGTVNIQNGSWANGKITVGPTGYVNVAASTTALGDVTINSNYSANSGLKIGSTNTVVNGRLSGTGSWGSAAYIQLGPTGTVAAAGNAVGGFNKGGTGLWFQNEATIEWQIKDRNQDAGQSGIGWDVIWGTTFDFAVTSEVDATLNLKIINAGLVGDIKATDVFPLVIVEGAGAIDIPTGVWTVVCDAPAGWDASGATLVYSTTVDFTGEGTADKVVYLTGLVSHVTTPGDTNDDGVVDAADYIAVKQNLGLTGGASLAQGNVDGDGDVDWNDLQIVMTNFGTGTGTAPAATTPEPATLGLLAIGALAVIRRRRRS